MVIQALLGLSGLRDEDVLAVQAFLTQLQGAALIFGGLHGKWPAQTGLPQGGALSTALFVVLLVQLHDKLVNNGCCTHLHLPDGTALTIAILAYIDDLLLIADSDIKFQRALTIVSNWARKIRMRLNVGKDKSAAMIINSSGLTASCNHWLLGDDSIPVVDTYKYLGLQLHRKGSWQPWANELTTKSRRKTLELVRWVRANHVTIDLISRLWTTYV